MTDRELLELAAKAAGIVGQYEAPDGAVEAGIFFNDGHDCLQWWNPLTDDGDALRLAVKLRLDLLFDGYDSPNAHIEVVANEPGKTEQPWMAEPMKTDPNAATRRAIVRAAAELGRN